MRYILIPLGCVGHKRLPWLVIQHTNSVYGIHRCRCKPAGSTREWPCKETDVRCKGVKRHAYSGNIVVFMAGFVIIRHY